MPTRQFLEQLEQKPKTVHHSTSWADPGNLMSDPEIAKKVVHVIRCIENGTPLPSGYYRKGVGLDSDGLLASDGIIHLHLGKSNTAELLYLVQYPDHVVLLELSDHSHFADRPVGKKLRSRHSQALAAKQAAIAAAKAAKPKRPTIKLGPRKQ